MAEKRWFTVDSAYFRKPVSQQVGTATVVSSTSPYSIPNAVTAYPDAKSGSYIFEVKYIGPEEPVVVIDSQDSRLEIGKNTHRLFKVAIGYMGSDRTSELVRRVKQVIDRVAAERGMNIENSTVVAAIIDQKSDDFRLAAEIAEESEDNRKTDSR